MKTTILSLLTATLLGLASFASTGAFAASDFLAIAFATGLVAWTFGQYSRAPRPLEIARPIRLPVIPVVRHAGEQVGRLAA